jgi:hypothetical protein
MSDGKKFNLDFQNYLQKLEAGNAQDKRVAAHWLSENSTLIVEDNHYMDSTLAALYKLGDGNGKAIPEAMLNIWEAGWLIDQQETLQRVDEALKGEGKGVKLAANKWLGQNADEIAINPEIMKKVLAALLDRWNNDDDEEVKHSADEKVSLMSKARRKIWEGRWQAEQASMRGEILERYLKEVVDNTSLFWAFYIDLVEWLGERTGEIAQDNHMVKETLNRLMESLERGDDNPRYRARVWEVIEEVWERSQLTERPEACEISGQVWNVVWKEGGAASQEKVVDQVCDILKNGSGEFRKSAADWLGSKAEEIVQHNFIQPCLKALKICIREEDNEGVRESAGKALKAIWNAELGKADWGADLALIWNTLNEDNCELRQNAVVWLDEKASKIVEFDNLVLLTHALKVLIVRASRDTDGDVRLFAWKATQNIGDKAWKIPAPASAGDPSNELDNKGSVRRQIILDQVLKALRESDDLRIKLAAIDWLDEKIGDLTQGNDAYRSYKRVADTLDEIRDEAAQELASGEIPAWDLQQLSGMEDLRDRADLALKRLWEIITKDEYQHQKSIIEDNKADENEMTTAIWLMADRNTLGSRQALRFLAGKWVEWIREGKQPRLVEYVAESIRYNRFAVLALIEYFGRKDGTNVDRRIARQLADMSDPAFFEDAESSQKQEYKSICAELKKHAVPVMLRRLPSKEEDVEIREHIVRMLGYTGGREGVDALARQLVSKEKMRKARQELLDEYYLKPSLKRSQDAADILNGTIEESKRTLRILQWLNIAVFTVGLTLLAVGLYVSLNSEGGASRVVGVLSSIGGFGGMIALLIRDPLDRIQNSMANLVHVETAFTSFIWELNLNGTYVQSLYVKNGKLEDQEIAETAQRIENSMETTMHQVAVHTERSEPRLVTRLNRLEPVAGNFPLRVTLHGQQLRGDTGQKVERSGMVAIDHRPVEVQNLSWQEGQVAFDLLDVGDLFAANGDKSQVMISLFVDGMETNALPFHVLK